MRAWVKQNIPEDLSQHSKEKIIYNLMYNWSLGDWNFHNFYMEIFGQMTARLEQLFNIISRGPGRQY